MKPFQSEFKVAQVVFQKQQQFCYDGVLVDNDSFGDGAEVCVAWTNGRTILKFPDQEAAVLITPMLANPNPNPKLSAAWVTRVVRHHPTARTHAMRQAHATREEAIHDRVLPVRSSSEQSGTRISSLSRAWVTLHSRDTV